MNSDKRDAIGGLIGIALFIIGMGIALFSLTRHNDHNMILGLSVAVAGIYIGKAPR